MGKARGLFEGFVYGNISIPYYYQRAIFVCKLCLCEYCIVDRPPSDLARIVVGDA